MNSQKFERHVKVLLKAIDTCLKNELQLPGLILLYTGIDSMAWLNRPKLQPDVRRNDFIYWVNRYLLPDSGLACEALDLYAARCALVHSYTSESSLTRQGKAKEIAYPWGKGGAKKLQKAMNSVDKNRAIAVHIEDLFHAFQNGIERFKEALSNDPIRAQLVFERIAKKYYEELPLNLIRILTDIE